MESSGTGRAHPPGGPRPVKGCSDLQSAAFTGLNELILSGLRLINPAAGLPEGHLVTSPVTPVPCVGKVRRPGPDCCFLCVLPAEKVTSLGKDWHRPCLRCAKCKKTLTPGSHAEVRKHHLSAPGHYFMLRYVMASRLRKRRRDTVA